MLELVVIIILLYVFIAVVKRPGLGLWLIPVGVALPRTLPRLYNMFGMLELSIAFLLVATLLHLVLYNKRIHIDLILKLMLLITIPIALSTIIGRGEIDSVRLYNWIGSCTAYFIALNIVKGTQNLYRVLFGFAIIVYVLVFYDFFFLSGLSFSITSAQRGVFRTSITAIGQANYIVCLATVLFPVAFVCVLKVKKGGMGLVGTALVIGNIILAVLVGTRASLLYMFSSVAAMTAVFIKISYYRKRIVDFIWMISSLLLITWFVGNYFSFELLSKLKDRIVSFATGDDPRYLIWADLIRVGLKSPIWGHGAMNPYDILGTFGIWSRHGVFPQIFFEYGVVVVIPIAIIFFVWVFRSFKLLKSANLPLSHDDIYFALASFGIAVGSVVSSLINIHIITTANYSALVFFLAGAVSAKIYQVDKVASRQGDKLRGSVMQRGSRKAKMLR